MIPVSPTPTCFYLDWGNTSLKIYAADGTKTVMSPDQLFNNDETTFAQWDHLFAVHECIKLVVSSVVPAGVQLLQRWQQKPFRDPEKICIHVLDHQAPWPLNWSKDQAPHLGIDRLMAMTGAFALHHNSAIVIDLGTCITVDVIKTCQDQAFPKWLGGLILPGAPLMAQAWPLYTAQLPAIQGPGQTSNIAYSTPSAMENGLYGLLKYGLQGLVQHLQQQHQIATTVITGGDALKIFGSERVAGQHLEPALQWHGLMFMASLV